MKRNIVLKKIMAGVSVVAISLGLCACNTPIKVDYGYNPEDYVKLGDYKNIEVSVDSASIEKDAINDKIQSDINSNVTYNETTRGAQDGDKLNLDFTATVGGQQADEFCNSDYEFNLGTDDFNIAGFSDALYGMKAGEHKIVVLSIPDDFEDLSYAGKKIVFEIVVNSVQQKITPMLTDAYVKEKYGCENIEAYRLKVKDEIQSTIDSNVEKAKREAILNRLNEICEVTNFPEDYYNQRKDEYNYSIGFYSTMKNVSNDEYCEDYYGLSFDEYVKKAVKQELIFQAIAVKDNVQVTEYDYKGNLESFANDNGYSSKDSFESTYGKEKIVKGMVLQKVQSIVVDNAKCTYNS